MLELGRPPSGMARVFLSFPQAQRGASGKGAPCHQPACFKSSRRQNSANFAHDSASTDTKPGTMSSSCPDLEANLCIFQIMPLSIVSDQPSLPDRCISIGQTPPLAWCRHNIQTGESFLHYYNWPLPMLRAMELTPPTLPRGVANGISGSSAGALCCWRCRPSQAAIEK